MTGVRPQLESTREAADGLTAGLRAEWDDTWVTRQEGCPPGQAPQRLGQIARDLVALAGALAARACGRAVTPESPHFGLYLGRLRGCLAHHWKQFAQAGPLPFAGVVARLAPDPAGKDFRGDLLAEVVLAQALQLGERLAAEVFETAYMPVVRSTARRVGGERAVEAVENFAAELVLPREGRGPRIATYSGRTALSHWLVPVVVNYWRTDLRRRAPISLALLPEPPARAAPPPAGPEGPCEEMLRPIFARSVAVLTAEERLLLQMLVLDGVPQKALAHSLGLNSGTITRRRQKATGALLEHLRQLVAASCRPGELANCLQLVLVGEDPELRSRLAAVLADGVRGTGPGGQQP